MKVFIKFLILSFSLLFLIGCSSTAKNNKDAASAKDSKNGSTIENISFEQVQEDKIPENMKNIINIIKANRGYIIYEYEGYSYIGIFSGEKNTGGFSIKVSNVKDNGGKISAVVEEKEPSKDDIVIQAITNPYTVIRVKQDAQNITIKNTKGEAFDRILKEDEMY